MSTSEAWVCQYRIAYRVIGDVTRVLALQAMACAIVPFGPVSALRYDHMVYTPVIADHFPVCLLVPPPVDPGKEAAGSVKPFRTRTSRSAHIIMISSPRTRNTHSHIARCTRRCAEMTRRIDAELTAVNDKK